MNPKSDKKKKRRSKNRKPLFLVLMLGGGLLLAIAAASALGGQPAPGGVPVEVQGTPNLVVDRDHVDLGLVKLGEWVEVSFKVANNGDQPLSFQQKPYVSVVEGC